MTDPTTRLLAAMFLRNLEAEAPESFFRIMAGDISPWDASCDTNMTMNEAMRSLLGRGAWLPSDVEEGTCTQREHDLDLELWNAAGAEVCRLVGWQEA